MKAEEFIKGFRELRLKMPRISLMGYQNQNCPYINNAYHSKNCYMCFNMDQSEGCLYSGLITRCKFCTDSEDIWDSELCYEGFEIYNSYNCDFSGYLRDCSDCSYSYDLLNCHNCFGCIGLRRANYHIFNRRYSPEEYKRRLAQVRRMSPEEIKAQAEALREKYPHNASRQYRTENCFGDNIQNSRDCFYCFNTKGVFEGGYLYDIYNVYGERSEEVYDSYFSVDLHCCYEAVQVGDGWNCNFSHCCEHLRESEFCELCFNSINLFGCISMQRKEFLILNKPYEKEAWHKEVAEIRDGLKKSGQYNWTVFD